MLYKFKIENRFIPFVRYFQYETDNGLFYEMKLIDKTCDNYKILPNKRSKLLKLINKIKLIIEIIKL
jgi:hypothetical protein